MAGGYDHTPKGIDAIVRKLRGLQRQIDEIRGSAGIKSAIVRGGILIIENPAGELVARIGENTTGTNPDLCGLTIGGWDETILFAYQDSTDDSSVVALGNAASGGVWDLDSFQVRAENVLFGASPPSAPDPSGPPLNTFYALSDQIRLTSPEIGLYEIPTTSSAANVFIGTVGSVWTLARVTSSRRYKTDIASARVDPADVLAIEPHTWIDKGDAEAAGRLVPRDPQSTDPDPDDLTPYVPPRQIGFIAEEVWAHESLQKFVGLDSEGQPDSFDYERFASVGLHAVCKAQQAEIDDLKSTVASLEERLAALESRA